MNAPTFSTIAELLRSGTKVSEIANRIDKGELYWHDEFNRVHVADDSEKEVARAALKTHLLMNDAWDISPGAPHVALYWDLWEAPDGPDTENHALARGRFIKEAQSDTPLTNTDNSHISDRLSYLKQAANMFWAGVDPNSKGTHPDNKTVTDWLEAHDYSPALAASGASIIRPSWAAKGRKPK